MKVFVGTMYSGEGDYLKCCDSVMSQNGITIEQMTISNMPEREAHNALWAEWRARQSTFDAFLKVDADTVLAHKNVIREYVKMVEENPRITGIQAPLADFFTDSFINGLNFFTSKVTFQDTKDDLFCDRHVDVGHDVVIKADNVSQLLKPAGYHCWHSSDIQAFHFGLHRKLKGQHHIIEAVKIAHTRIPHRIRGLALMGAKYATEFERDRSFNYTDGKLNESFQRAVMEYESQHEGASAR